MDARTLGSVFAWMAHDGCLWRLDASQLQQCNVLRSLHFSFFVDCHTRAMLGPSHRETRSAVSHTGRCVRILSLSLSLPTNQTASTAVS